MFFGSFLSDSASSENFFGATTFLFSSALPLAARGGKGLVFEDGPGFESAFRLFHGWDGIVPLSGMSFVPNENCNESIDVKPEPALPFNPLAARAATIKQEAQQSRPCHTRKPNNPDQNSMKQKGGNPLSHEALSNEWLENGQCPLARLYRAMSGVLPLVGKVLQPPAGVKLKCPRAVVAVRAALACTALVKALRPQSLPAKMVAITLLGMAANIPLGVWREHTKKFSPDRFAAVHAAVPFIAMLRTAMAFTIAASILLGRLSGKGRAHSPVGSGCKERRRFLHTCRDVSKQEW